MSKSIYLMSTKSNSCKTVISIGLFTVLKENGKKSGYFKPIGDPFSDFSVTKADKDVTIIQKLLERKYSREEICPIFISPLHFLDEIPFEKVDGVKDLIKNAFDEIILKAENIIIEGNHSYAHYYTLGLNDIELAKLLNSDAILVSRAENDTDIDSIIIAADNIIQHGLNLKGVILCDVSMLQVTKTKERYDNILKDKNIKVLGVIPSSRLLSSPTVGEVLDATGGNLLTEDLDIVKDNVVENFIIGAMQSNDALSYMRKSLKLGVITGGDRADIILISIEVGASLIVLTGNLKPDLASLARAKEAGIPVILVNMDTYTTAQNIQNISTKIQVGEVELCKKLIEDNVDWRNIFEIQESI
ncbi:MAG: AAA family ATPase [Promethearchaeota archaeon]